MIVAPIISDEAAVVERGAARKSAAESMRPLPVDGPVVNVPEETIPNALVVAGRIQDQV